MLGWDLLPNWAKLIFWLELAAISGYYAFQSWPLTVLLVAVALIIVAVERWLHARQPS